MSLQRTSGGLHLLWTGLLPEAEAHGSGQDARQSPRPQSGSHQVEPAVPEEKLDKRGQLSLKVLLTFWPLLWTGSPQRVAPETEVCVWGRWSATVWLVTERACCCWSASWSPATPSRWTCAESVACWDTPGGTFLYLSSMSAWDNQEDDLIFNQKLKRNETLWNREQSKALFFCSPGVTTVSPPATFPPWGSRTPASCCSRSCSPWTSSPVSNCPATTSEQKLWKGQSQISCFIWSSFHLLRLFKLSGEKQAEDRTVFLFLFVFFTNYKLWSLQDVFFSCDLFFVCKK